MKVLRTIALEAPPDRVAEVLCSEVYNLERERAREEVVSTSFKLVESTPQRTIFELHTTEYGRTMTGAIDRSHRVASVTRNVWNPADQTLSWTYQGGAAPKRMRLGGLYRLKATASGCTLEHEVNIEVKLPLVGESIARAAAREFERTAEHYEQILQRHAQQAAAPRSTR
jgi:hypothetical protein